MNQTTRFILGIYQVSLMVRDTFEYVQNKETFDINFYKQRKQYLEHGLVEQAPLSKFLEQNGEVGQTIRKNLDDFYNSVYGPESTIVSIDGEKLVVDKAQAIKLTDYIVGLHETLCDVMKGFVAQSKNDGSYEEEVDTFLKFDEKFFRAIACINLVDLIHAQFIEFNKLMTESKGQQTPQSNFVINDLKKLVGFLKFENEHADKEDESFKHAYEESFKMLQYMEGSKNPKDDGTTIRDQILECRKLWQIEIGKNEPEWRDRYTKLWEKLVEFEKNLHASAENKAA